MLGQWLGIVIIYPISIQHYSAGQSSFYLALYSFISYFKQQEGSYRISTLAHLPIHVVFIHGVSGSYCFALYCICWVIIFYPIISRFAELLPLGNSVGNTNFCDFFFRRWVNGITNEPQYGCIK